MNCTKDLTIDAGEACFAARGEECAAVCLQPRRGKWQSNSLPDDPALLTDGSVDGLPDPPMGVGGELEASGVVKTINALDEASDALGNQVRQLHAPAHVLPGYRHDQPLIADNHLLLGIQASLDPGDKSCVVCLV